MSAVSLSLIHILKDHHFDLTGVYSMTEYQNEFMRGDGACLSYKSLWYASVSYTHLEYIDGSGL